MLLGQLPGVTEPVTRGLLCTCSAGGSEAVPLCLAVSTSTLDGLGKGWEHASAWPAGDVKLNFASSWQCVDGQQANACRAMANKATRCWTAKST